MPHCTGREGREKENAMGKGGEKDEEARNYFPVLTISLPESNVPPSFTLEGTGVLRDEAPCPRSQSQECVRSQLNQVCKSTTLALKRMLSDVFGLWMVLKWVTWCLRKRDAVLLRSNRLCSLHENSLATTWPASPSPLPSGSTGARLSLALLSG